VAEGEPAPRSGLLLAVAVGLCASLALGGGWLFWSGYRTLNQPQDCAERSPEECAMEQDIAFAWADRQLTLGTILVVIGGALSLVLWLTERRRDAPSKE
jgi:hypothetical protein